MNSDALYSKQRESSPTTTLGRASPSRHNRSRDSNRSGSRRGSTKRDDFETELDRELFGNQSKGSRASDRELERPKSPGFGLGDDSDRLETFGRGNDNDSRRHDGKDSRTKTAYERNRNQNINPNIPKGPGTQYDRRKGTKPPTIGKLDRSGRPQSGRRGPDDRTRSQNRGIKSGQGSNYGRSDRGDSRPMSVVDSKFSDHIDKKLSKKGYTEPNFLQTKKKREKDWLLDYKAHRVTPSALNKTDQPPKDTKSYLIIINGVNSIPSENIPLLKEKGTKALLNYSVTLYDQKERDFFGRSYSSRPIQLNPTNKETINKEFIYIHTATKSADVVAIIESFLEVVPADSKIKSTYISLGFSLFEMFDDKNKIAQNKLLMYMGSPRMLITVPFKSFLQHPCTMNVEIKHTQDLDVLKPLLPSMTF